MPKAAAATKAKVVMGPEVVNSEAFREVMQAMEAELAKQWNLLHGGLDRLEEGEEPKKIEIGIKAVMSKVKKETEEDLTLTLQGSHRLETKKVAGVVSLSSNQLKIKFINDGDEDEEFTH